MNGLLSAPRTPKPPWLRVDLPTGDRYRFLKDTLGDRQLNTVCEEARCPNIGECWGGGTATFMVLGDTCTRGCRFCAVKTWKSGTPVDPDEPRKVAEAIRLMNLDYVVITSVDRDDLPDQGAGHFAEVIRTVKRETGILVEVLIPDFRADREALQTIVEATPDVAAHNVETVRRLTPSVRDAKASYDQSLNVLSILKELNPRLLTKSSLMVGLGETELELNESFQDLRREGVNFLTLGQYLKPSSKHLDVNRFVSPEEFDRLGETAKRFGFDYVVSGPLVRSSYRAGEFYNEVSETNRTLADDLRANELQAPSKKARHVRSLVNADAK